MGSLAEGGLSFDDEFHPQLLNEGEKVGSELPTSPPQDRPLWTWVIAFASSTGYALSYFWRYTIFILPEDILGERVVTIFHRDLDLQAWR